MFLLRKTAQGPWIEPFNGDLAGRPAWAAKAFVDASGPGPFRISVYRVADQKQGEALMKRWSYVHGRPADQHVDCVLLAESAFEGLPLHDCPDVSNDPVLSACHVDVFVPDEAAARALAQLLLARPATDRIQFRIRKQELKAAFEELRAAGVRCAAEEP